MHMDERRRPFSRSAWPKGSARPLRLFAPPERRGKLAPAVARAFLRTVPLVVLTADRPHELRDNGAPQSMDQTRLYGPHAKWFFDLAEPVVEHGAVNHIRTVACPPSRPPCASRRAPVHLNCPTASRVPQVGPCR